MESLMTQIAEGRMLKENTVKNYSSALKKLALLCTGSEWKGTTFLLNTDSVCAKLKAEHPITTIKTKLVSILVAIQPTKPGVVTAGYEEVVPIYRKYLEEVRGEIDEQASKREKTETEMDKWVTMAGLTKITKSYAFKLRKLGYTTRPGVLKKPKHFDLMQKYLVSSLYTMIPPVRNSYAGMKIVSDKTYEEMTKEQHESGNYLVVTGSKKKVFKFGDLKTSYKRDKDYNLYHVGVVTNEIPKDLNRVLNLWLNYNHSDDLLLNSRGGAMSKTTFGTYINAVFAETGKVVGSRIIRKVYLTEKYGHESTPEEKQQDAVGMHHTVDAASKNYIKKID